MHHESAGAMRTHDRDLWLLVALAAAKLAFHLATNGQYGFHRDELQTLSDARHLDWGFVAYPPLTPFLGRIEWTLFGASLTGFRFFAALSQSVAMVVIGLLARRLGGGRIAMLTAAFAAMLTPVSLAASSRLQYGDFDYLWFVLAAYFLVRRIDSGDARWWLAIGAAVGLGAMSKYTAAFYAAGLAAGVLFTPLRVDLRNRWLWLGVAVTTLLVAPNIVWLARHDFVTFDFLQFIHARDVGAGRADGFWLDQLRVSSNLFTLPLWLLGLYFVCFADGGRPYRVLAWMVVVPFAIFVLAKGRGYYTGSLYPVLYAAGAAALHRWLSSRTLRAQRIAWSGMALLVLAGTCVVPVVLPLVPVNSAAWPFVSEQDGDLREEIGWPELAREVAHAWHTLTPEERAHAGVWGNNYGEAGALELYGPALGLPAPIGPTNSFWLRGPGHPAPSILVVVGLTRDSLSRACGSVELAGHVFNDAGVRNEESVQHPDIFICRNLHPPLEEVWPKLREFG